MMHTPTTYALGAGAGAASADYSNDPIGAERAEALPDAGCVRLVRRYAAGEQDLPLSPEIEKILAGLLEYAFCDNLIDQVISANAARLEFQGFDIERPDPSATTAPPELDFLNELRVKCQLDAFSAIVHHAVCRDGNHAVGLDRDKKKQRSLVFQEPWWNGHTGMYVAYDGMGRMGYAVKEWYAPEPEPEFRGLFGGAREFFLLATGQLARSADRPTLYRWRTIYYPDRIERYRKRDDAGGEWEDYAHIMEDGSGRREPWPAPWLRPDGRPLGIPVVHFANRSRGGNPNYGDTETPESIIATQVHVNDIHLDAMGLARMYGYPIGVISGIDTTDPDTGGPIRDDKGNPIDLPDLEWGKTVRLSNPAARAALLPPADSEHLLTLLDMKIDAICRGTSTPRHLLKLGGNISGEAIIRAETFFTAKIQQQINRLIPAYAALAHKAMEQRNARMIGGELLNEDLLITALFAPADRPDALTQMTLEERRVKLDQLKVQGGGGGETATAEGDG